MLIDTVHVCLGTTVGLHVKLSLIIMCTYWGPVNKINNFYTEIDSLFLREFRTYFFIHVILYTAELILHF